MQLWQSSVHRQALPSKMLRPFSLYNQPLHAMAIIPRTVQTTKYRITMIRHETLCPCPVSACSGAATGPRDQLLGTVVREHAEGDHETPLNQTSRNIAECTCTNDDTRPGREDMYSSLSNTCFCNGGSSRARMPSR